MPIDMENLNPGIWFDYPEDGAEERVCIRRLNQEKLAEITTLTQKTHVAFKQPVDEKGRVNRRMPPQRVEWTEVINPELRDEMIWDFTITDWKLFDLDNQDIYCTKENKIKLMRMSGSFPLFWAECINRLDEIEGKHEEALEKN